MAYQDYNDHRDSGHLDFDDHADSYQETFSDHSDTAHGDTAHSDVSHVDGYAGPSAHSFQDYSGLGAARYWHNDIDPGECERVTHLDSFGYMQLAAPPAYPYTWVGPCSSTRHADSGNLPGKAQCDEMPSFWDYSDHGDYGDHSDVAHTDSAHTDSAHADFNDSTQETHSDGTDHQDTDHEDTMAHNDVAPPPAPSNLAAEVLL